MTKAFAALAIVALIGLSLPMPASAGNFTYACEPSTQPAPRDWVGGPWAAPVRLEIDTTSRSVDLFDKDNVMIATTAQPFRLGGLNNHEMDMTVTENVIKWGVLEMWGFSGYINLKSGQLDLMWANPAGYNADTLNRQFHGTCKEK